LVLDPFCGTGTTLVECKKKGTSSVGIEAHPMGHFAYPLEMRPSGRSAEGLVSGSGLRASSSLQRQDPDVMRHATEVHVL
jgi:hypothetical protein